MKETITRADFIERFSKQLFIPHEQSSFFLELIIQQIYEALHESQQLKISSFGTFLVHDKKERVGRNPKTGEEAVVTSRKSVSFRASPILRNRVNKKSHAP
jgi:integration host factor subunit alpha